MAEQSHTPSRRAMLAGLAATPIAGLPAIAGAVAPMSKELAQAIARHGAAQAAYDAAALAEAPETELDRLCDEAGEALRDLAETPAQSDAELIEKLRYLLAAELHVIGEPPNAKLEFGSMPRAIFLHFDPEAQS